MIDTFFQSKQFPSLSVRYRIFGSGKKLLFLHGTWVDPFIFDELLTSLSSSYELLIPDIPPFGKSRCDQILSLEEYGVLFDELLTSLGWYAVSVVGHSFGGGIALHLATTSKRVDTVVGCNPIGIPFRRPDILKKYPKMIFRALSKLAAEKNSAILHKLILDVGRVLLRNPVYPIVQTITQCLCEDEHVLKRISIPVFIIWGKQDELLPIMYMKRLKKLVPQVHIRYIEGHHNWCLVDQPSALRYITTALSG